MKIFVCQTSPKVGAIEENYKVIQENYQKALSKKADICVFPELCISGYLAEDLFLKKDFIEKLEKITIKLVNQTLETCLLLPTILYENDHLYNAVIAAQNGEIIGVTHKKILPNHGVFDEKRYFTSGESQIIEINNIKIGVPICEDIWHPEICANLAKQGAEIFIVPNASPYEKEKLQKRIQIACDRFNETNIPLIYCNQSLAHDGIIFDGRSFCFDGEMKIIGENFATNSTLLSYVGQRFSPAKVYDETYDLYDEILKATILGIQNYVHDNGFKKVILGLSGGIDSSIVAYIAVKALGKENVSCYMMPSKFTTQESLDDARDLAKNLGFELESIPIQNIVDEFSNIFAKNENSITYQNLQSRTRGTILMGIANETRSLLLTTGNKSEYATGYATIYGDMNGAFNPIKDLYKTEIFDLAKYINLKSEIIPQNIISKEPSAELAQDQKDSDSLPDYKILDQILDLAIEKLASREEICKKFDKNTVDKILNLLKVSEFKRFQSAPGVKISNMHFDKDRRFPITNFYTN